MTVESEIYEGWSNRETWLVSVWIHNERHWYEYIYGEARRIEQDPTINHNRFHLSQFIEAWLSEMLARSVFDDSQPRNSIQESMFGLVRDLFPSGRVNFSEIADSILQSLLEEELLNKSLAETRN
jgi:hypothetical protein